MKIVFVARLLGLAACQADRAEFIRDRLDKYLLDYEPQLSNLVADERMTQRDGASSFAN